MKTSNVQLTHLLNPHSSLRTVKVWVKRDNGQYWPSIVQSFEGRLSIKLAGILIINFITLTASCSALEYGPDNDGHFAFIGLSNGQIHVSSI